MLKAEVFMISAQKLDRKGNIYEGPKYSIREHSYYSFLLSLGFERALVSVKQSFYTPWFYKLNNIFSIIYSIVAEYLQDVSVLT